MIFDLFLVIGIIIGLLALPAILSAFSESKSPRSAAIMVLISGGLILIAVTQHTGSYSIENIPDVFVRVFAYYLG